MKFIKIFLATIFSIAFTIILTAGIFIFSIKSFISKENITQIVTDTDLTTIIDYDLTENPEINEIYLEIPEVKELADNLIAQTLDYIINDKDVPKITEEDIYKIVNSEYYQNKLGITLTEEEKTLFVEGLQEVYETTNKTIETELSTIKNDIYEDEYIKVLLSPNLLPIITIALIVLVLLIGICRWSWYRSLAWIGTSMIIAGIINIIFKSLIESSVLPEIPEINDITANLITQNLIQKWFNNSLTILISGILLLISYFIINKMNKSNESKLASEL